MSHAEPQEYWNREVESRLRTPWPDPVLPFDPDGPGLRIYPLGTSGSAPGKKTQTSSYLLEKDGYRILLDAGTGFLLNYPPNRSPMEDLDAIAVTHLHPDHTGDLEQFAVMVSYGLPGGVARGDIPADKKFTTKILYGPRGTRDYLKARINAYEEAELITDAVLDRVFDVVEFDYPPAAAPLEALESAERPTVRLRDGFSFTAVPVHHVSAADRVPAFGYRFEAERSGKPPLVVAFTGDTIDHPNLRELVRGATCVIGDAAGPPVHLTAGQLGELAEATGVTEVGITHLIPWLKKVPGSYLAELRARFRGKARVLISGTCCEIDDDGFGTMYWSETGQPVTPEEEATYLRGLDPMPRRFVPPGAEYRLLPGFPEEPGARLRARLSDPDFWWETVATAEDKTAVQPENLDALAGVVRGEISLPELWSRFGRRSR